MLYLDQWSCIEHIIGKTFLGLAPSPIFSDKHKMFSVVGNASQNGHKIELVEKIEAHTEMWKCFAYTDGSSGKPKDSTNDVCKSLNKVIKTG